MRDSRASTLFSILLLGVAACVRAVARLGLVAAVAATPIPATVAAAVTAVAMITNVLRFIGSPQFWTSTADSQVFTGYVR
jgi:hypothetical protein